MQNSTVVKISLVLVAFGFLVGRLTAVQSKAVQTQTQEENVNKEKNTHTETITTTVKTPDGTVKTTTTTDIVSNTQINKQIETKSSVVSKPKVNISLLAAYDIKQPNGIVYGLSANKEFIGSITIGAFGLTNGTIGISAGLDF